MSLTCPHCGHGLGLVLQDLGVDATGADETQLPDATGANGAVSLGAVPSADVFALRLEPKPRQRKHHHYNAKGWVRFWELYPVKLDKRKAYDAYCAALDAGADAADLIAGAERYAHWVVANCVEPRHVKYAQGWLNGERWTDELDIPAAANEGDPAWVIGTPEYAARVQADEERAIREMA